MQTQWSRNEIQKEFTDCQTLKQIIAKLEERFWALGHVICSVKVNGMLLSEEDESQFSEENIGVLNTLEIQLSQPNVLWKETTKSYLELIPQLTTLTVSCAEGFRTHKLNQAQPQFLDILDGCRWLNDALFLLKSQIMQNQQFPIDAEWRKAEEDYAVMLKQVLLAFEAKDYVLLSDLLEYELTNRLEQWQTLLLHLQKMLN